MHRLRPLVAVLLLAGCQASTQDPGDIDAPMPEGLLEGSRSVELSDPAVIRARLTDGFRAPIVDARSPFDTQRAPRSLRLNLFEDATYDALLVEIDRSAGALIWRGELAGHPGSSVVLAVRGEALSGTVRVRDRLYTLRPRRDGTLVVEWDQTNAPVDAPSVVPSTRQLPSILTRDVRARADGEAQIDVLVLFTSEAAAAAGGDGIEATIALAVDEANQSYAASGVAARLALLETREVVYDETDFDFDATLGRLATPGDGFLDGAQALRDELGADHVVLIVDHAGPWAGIGFQMTGANADFFAGFAYSVVSRDYAVGFYTFAHELGHNMGANHDPEHGSGGYRADSQGHQVPDAGYRTVMAYSCEGVFCGRVGRWSNPGLSHEGHVTGIAGVSDNAATLNDTAFIASEFRDRPAPPPPANARIESPVDGSTLAPGPVRFEWTDVGADAHYLMVGRSPGDDSIVRAHAGRETSFVAERLPEDGSILHVRLWTLRGLDWGYEDHVFTAHRAAFEGAALVLPYTALDSSWAWFAWQPVEGALGYRLELGTEGEPGRYYDREVSDRWVLALGLPVDGSSIQARLSTLGPSGWVSRESTFDAWRAPSHAAVITSPRSGSHLESEATFRWEETDAHLYWLVLQTMDGVVAATPATETSVHISGIPTDGRDIIALLYSRGPDSWVATSAGYLTGR